MKLKIAALATTVVLILAFAVIVWPTRYKETQVDRQLLREDRLTGEIRVFNGGRGWISLAQQACWNEPPPPEPRHYADLKTDVEATRIYMEDGQKWAKHFDECPNK